MIEFKYYGKIKSKGRPRHRIVKGQKAIYAQTYTDKQTQEYEIRPTTKPDADNIAKAVLDSLNAVAYPDDKQICDLHITKYYAEQEYMIVRIFTIEEEFKWKLEYLSKKYSKN